MEVLKNYKEITANKNRQMKFWGHILKKWNSGGTYWKNEGLENLIPTWNTGGKRSIGKPKVIYIKHILENKCQKKDHKEWWKMFKSHLEQ